MRPGRIALHAALAVVFSIGLASCDSPTAPDGEPDLKGTITAVYGEGREMWVHVEELELPATNYEEGISLYPEPFGRAAWVFVRSPDGTLRRGSAADLVVGAKIMAWTTGLERRSLPPQWDATSIVVLVDGS